MGLVYFLTALSSLLLLGFSLQLFLVNTGNKYLNRLFALFLFSRFTENLVYILILSGKFAFFPILLKLFGPLSLSAPAFFYLYLSGFLKDKFSFDKRDWVHFIPCIISLVDIAAIFWQSSAEIAVNVEQIGLKKSFIYEERIGVFSGLHLFYIRQGLYAFYFLILGSIIYKSRIIQRWNWKPVQNRWVVSIFVSIFLLQYSRFTISFLADKVEYSNSGLLTIAAIISTSIIFVIMLYLLYNPKLLYGFIFIDKDNAIGSFNTVSPSLKGFIDTKYKKTDLFSVDIKQLYTSAILGFMADEKPYLNPDFRIADISKKLNITVHHCSYILNYELNKNFRDWINGYRIQYFIEQFLSKSGRVTIEALAKQSGFSTNATFYNAFKKEKGISPTVYFKEIASQ